MISAELRRHPYPYKAMMTICSDLDETPDSDSYFEIVKFLNTQELTRSGPGVGLELGNTIYFDMPSDQFAYWNTDTASREKIRTLIASGHVDCFHSFGDLATSRAHAERALEELEKYDCRIECWVDHAAARTNFGADIMQGQGDIVGSDAYHADISYEHGVRFVWRGRVTSVIGQGCRRSLIGLFNAKQPRQSSRTIATEGVKGLLARHGNGKYAMHAKNDVLQPATLRDGHRIFEFLRCNPYWGGVSKGATADGLGEVLTEKFLNKLVARGGDCILYTHLGKTSTRGAIFNADTVSALRMLAQYQARERILVTTTRRLLGYRATHENLTCTISNDNGIENVYLDTSRLGSWDMCADLDGLAVYVNDSKSARLFVDGQQHINVQRNGVDEHGKQSVSVPWRTLSFPRI